MNGLEQILLKIEEDNQTAVSQIISDAKAEADSLINDKKAQADEQAVELISEAKKHSAQISENAESGYHSIIRKGELQAKAEIVDSWINKAMNEIAAMDDESYFSTIFNLILSHSSKLSGELLFNEKDKKRMPANFLKMLNEALEEGAELSLADENADIENGCIIRYGGIEENCTFDALLDERADEVKDKLFSIINS